MFKSEGGSNVIIQSTKMGSVKVTSAHLGKGVVGGGVFYLFVKYVLLNEIMPGVVLFFFFFFFVFLLFLADSF